MVYIKVLQCCERMLKILRKFQAVRLAPIMEHSRRKSGGMINDDP